MKNNKDFYIIDEDSHLKNIKKKNNINNRFLYLYFFFFLLFEIAILIIIFYIIKLVFETKVLLIKQNQITSEERELFINQTNKLIIENKNLIKEKIIFNQINYKNEFKFYRLLCPKEVVGKKKELKNYKLINLQTN